MNVKDKVVVVTGGASGIGRAMAARFLAEGARHAVVADINEAGLQQVAEEIGALAVPTDVSKEEDVINLVRTAEKEFGQIDLLCSNAGIGLPGGVNVANDGWQKIWEINVMAHVYAARAALPAMIARGDGYLLNTSSAAGLVSQIGSAPYSVTKHAAVGLAEWLAITHAHQGIKVSVLCPQAVRTPMLGDSDGGVAGLDGMIEPEELCDTVVEALEKETFLILPHPDVLTYMQRKANDYDRWIGGMQRLQQRLGLNDMM
jgi:NAD(P)-dependent dehydrogenase (short-subunit alcohol dehydrogenase family)